MTTQPALGISVVASQWILNLTLMLLAGLVTVGGTLGDRLGHLKWIALAVTAATLLAALMLPRAATQAQPSPSAGQLAK